MINRKWSIKISKFRIALKGLILDTISVICVIIVPGSAAASSTDSILILIGGAKNDIANKKHNIPYIVQSAVLFISNLTTATKNSLIAESEWKSKKMSVKNTKANMKEGLKEDRT